MTTEATKAKLRPKPAKAKGFLKLSTGSTLVNLALTGHASWGLAGGSYYLFVGDSKAGKTFLALQTLAEASINPGFDKHQLVYFDVERGARMDLQKFFGKKMKERLKVIQPRSVEDFYRKLDDVASAGPYVGVLDSMDALVPEAQFKKAKQVKAAMENGQEASGSFGTDKAKLNSANLRVATANLDRDASVLVFISQTRDRIGFGSQFNPKTRSGGKSLTFFATAEMWFSIEGTIKKTVRGKARKIGTVLKVKITKARDTGREPDVLISHYPSAGFDDVGSLVDFLISEKHWKEVGEKPKRVEAPEFKHEGSKESLVQLIDKDAASRRTLRMLVAETWKEIELACAVTRTPRYI